jgi:hypothetical protein
MKLARPLAILGCAFLLAGCLVSEKQLLPVDKRVTPLPDKVQAISRGGDVATFVLDAGVYRVQDRTDVAEVQFFDLGLPGNRLIAAVTGKYAPERPAAVSYVLAAIAPDGSSISLQDFAEDHGLASDVRSGPNYIRTAAVPGIHGDDLGFDDPAQLLAALKVAADRPTDRLPTRDYRLISARSTEAADACDRLAADPSDPDRQGPGVAFAEIDTDAAIPACQEATDRLADASPDGLGRIPYQLARALAATGAYEAAALNLRLAIDRGHVWSILALAGLYDTGSGVPRSPDQALALYLRAQTLGLDPIPAALANRGIDLGDLERPDLVGPVATGLVRELDHREAVPYFLGMVEALAGNEQEGLEGYDDCLTPDAIAGAAAIMAGLQLQLYTLPMVVDRDEPMIGVASVFVDIATLQLAGRRDAERFHRRYPCDSDAGRTFLHTPASTFGAGGPPVSERAGASGGGRFLVQQSIGPLMSAWLTRECFDDRSALATTPPCQRQRTLSAQGYTVLLCDYGPDPTREGIGLAYRFWSEKVPPSPSEFDVPGHEPGFAFLGGLAADRCPATLDEAKELHEASIAALGQ